MKKSIEKIRYYLIQLIAKDMPIVLNMNIARPKNYSGSLAYFPDHTKPGLFSDNFLWDKESESILTPRRDVDIT